tara:strand:+ start:264 stop:2666 length:2403 start_codon:yes stop_codon:yes gene_type:complete
MEEYRDIFTSAPFIIRLCDRVVCATATPDFVVQLLIGVLNLAGVEYNYCKEKVVVALNRLTDTDRMEQGSFFGYGGVSAVSNLLSDVWSGINVETPFVTELLDLVHKLCERSARALEFLSNDGLVDSLRMILERYAEKWGDEVTLGIVSVLQAVAIALDANTLTNTLDAEKITQLLSSRVSGWLSPEHQPSLRIQAVSLFNTVARHSKAVCVSQHERLMGRLKPTIIDDLLQESQRSSSGDVPLFILGVISETTLGQTSPWSERCIPRLVDTIETLLQTILKERRHILMYDSNRSTTAKPAWSVKELVKQEGALWRLCETVGTAVAVGDLADVFVNSGGLKALGGVLSIIGSSEEQDPSISAARTISLLYKAGVVRPRRGGGGEVGGLGTDGVAASFPSLVAPFEDAGFDRCARFVRRQHDFMSHMMQIWRCVIQEANPVQDHPLLVEAMTSLVAYTTRVSEAIAQVTSRSDRNLEGLVEASDGTIEQALNLLVLVFSSHDFNETHPNKMHNAITGCIALIKHASDSGSETTSSAFHVIATLCDQARSNCKTFAVSGGIQLLAPMIRAWTRETEYGVATEILRSMLTHLRGATVPIMVDEELVKALSTSLKCMIKKRGMSLYYESAINTLECIKLLAEYEGGGADAGLQLYTEEVTNATLKLVGFDSERASASGLRTLSTLLKFERETVKPLIFRDADIVTAKIDACMCGVSCDPLRELLNSRSTDAKGTKRQRIETGRNSRLAKARRGAEPESESASESEPEPQPEPQPDPESDPESDPELSYSRGDRGEDRDEDRDED